MRFTLAITASTALALGCGGATSTINGDGGGGNAAGSRGPVGSVVEDGGTTDTVDAGPGGTTSGLPCGSATCMIPGETCCVTDTGNASSFACVVGSSCPQPGGDDAAGNNNTQGGGDDAAGNNNTGDNGGNDGPSVTALQCSGASNCPAGTVCCAVSTDNSASSSCLPSCGRRDAQLCDPTAPTTGCSASAPCSTSGGSDLGLPPSFGICGGSN